jgi:hypothetical protein
MPVSRLVMDCSDAWVTACKRMARFGGRTRIGGVGGGGGGGAGPGTGTKKLGPRTAAIRGVLTRPVDHRAEAERSGFAEIPINSASERGCKLVKRSSLQRCNEGGGDSTQSCISFLTVK